MGCKELRRNVTHGQCRDTLRTGAVAGEEVVCTYGGSASRLNVYWLAGFATWVFAVALAASNAALASRVIRDVGQTVYAKSLQAHAVRALSGSRCPTFFNFFFLSKGRVSEALSPYRFFPPFLDRVGRTRARICSYEARSGACSFAQVPLTWAYRLYTSMDRSLQ